MLFLFFDTKQHHFILVEWVANENPSHLLCWLLM